MEIKNRQTFLMIATGAVAGLWFMDYAVIEPAVKHWESQTEDIAALRAKVQNGHQLLQRETALRNHWSEMLRTQLPEDLSAAENNVIAAIGQWARDSRINFTSFTPQWRTHPEGYETLECTAAASGDQASLGHLIYALETDPLPARLAECELAARDPKGQQLNLTLKFSFIRFTDLAKTR